MQCPVRLAVTFKLADKRLTTSLATAPAILDSGRQGVCGSAPVRDENQTEDMLDNFYVDGGKHARAWLNNSPMHSYGVLVQSTPSLSPRSIRKVSSNLRQSSLESTLHPCDWTIRLRMVPRQRPQESRTSVSIAGVQHDDADWR